MKNILKYLLASGFLLFTLDHPYLVLFTTLVFIFNTYVSDEEKQTLMTLLKKTKNLRVNLNKFKNTKDLIVDTIVGDFLDDYEIADIVTPQKVPPVVSVNQNFDTIFDS